MGRDGAPDPGRQHRIGEGFAPSVHPLFFSLWSRVAGCPAGAPRGDTAAGSAHPSSVANRCSPACSADGRENNAPHSRTGAQQGQTHPSPPCPETPALRALPRPLWRHREPPAPPAPLPRSSFPGLGCARTEQLIYHPVPPWPCGCCLQQRSWEGEKISQVGPRQELKTYALATNASPGARGDRGEPSTGFSTAASFFF